jgi:8-oxo-dGTP diphosphatase
MKSINYNVTIDCVIFGYDFKCLNIIVLERVLRTKDQKDFIINDLKLPGNFLYDHEDFDEGASRIVKDLTGLNHIELHQFKAFGAPDRISNEKDLLWFKHINYPVTRVFTIGYYSLLKPHQMNLPLTSVEHAKWYPVYKIKKMAYDHQRIVAESLEALRVKVRLQSHLVFNLLPVKFTMSQLLGLYEEIYQIKLDRRNFYKKINSLDYIVQLNEKQQDVAHKPGWLYMFSNDLYEQSVRELNII